MTHIEDRPEVYREHFDECLKHFGKWFNSKLSQQTRGRLEALKPMMDFCEVGHQTGLRWINHGTPLPGGETRIRLVCYLDLHGYKIIEFERVAKVLRNFIELIGFGILSVDQAVSLTGFKDASNLYLVLWEKGGLSKEKEDRMYAVWKERREELAKKKEKSFEISRLEVLFKPAKPVQQLALTASPSNGTAIGARHTAVLGIIENALALIEEGLFEGLSDSELSHFAQPILQLSSRLSVLSSKVLTAKGDR